jgi:hypothetical protein
MRRGFSALRLLLASVCGLSCLRGHTPVSGPEFKSRFSSNYGDALAHLGI